MTRPASVQPSEWLSLFRLEVAHWRRKRRQPLAGFTRAFVKRFGMAVRNGPFTGMIFTHRGS